MADEIVNPHVTDEDPESFIGKLIKDPWNDDSQIDWDTSSFDDGTEPEDY